MAIRVITVEREYGSVGGDIAAQLAGKLGLSSVAHAHWQFYLPTSLARTNLLCALSMRREDAFLLLGATYAMDIDHAAFIEDMEPTRSEHSGAEGVGVDSSGNVYGAVVRRQMLERHVRGR